MSEQKYEIVMNSEYEDFNLDLLKDYWDFSNLNEGKFSYTIKSLLNKYDITTSAKLERIVKHSGYLRYTDLKECKKCYLNYEIFKRKEIDFKRWNSYKEKLVCNDCRSAYIKEYMRNYLDSFKELIPQSKEDEKSSNQSQLSYLEKILMFVILESTEIDEENYIKINSWHSFNQLEAHGLEKSIKKLFDKGYIFKTNQYEEFNNKQIELKGLESSYKNYISDEMRNEIKLYLSLQFKGKVEIILPTSFENIKQWSEKLYDEIIESELMPQDYKEIELYINTKRLKEVYALLDFVCQYKKIPIRKNNALELDLMRMIVKYDLQHIFSLFWYQAKFASDRLRTLELSSDDSAKFSKDYVFGKKISSYLDHLDRVNEKPKFPRSLPENWSYSEVELFISAHIIGNYERWEKFTPSEILTLLEEKKGIKLEPISV